MSLTRDQKGKIALGVLGAAALYMVYSSFLAGPPGAPSGTTSRVNTAAPVIPAATEQSATRRTIPTRGRGDEFHPVWRSKRSEDRVDPMKIDPTLRTDLLAKVMAVEPSGGSRNLFAFGSAPKVAELKGPEPKLLMGPKEAPKPPPAPGEPVKPPPPPITLKFYGFSTVRNNGKKSAYFLDGDDILIASEGETLKRRYKLVRITASSVLMEDLESKQQQTVPLTPEAGPS